MSEKTKARRTTPAKRAPQARIRTLNKAHAEEVKEFSQRGEKKRLFPEPEPRGRYVP